MAEFDKAQPNQFEQRGTNPFNNPTPGESLTRDPEQKFPWEQPPQLNEVEPVIISGPTCDSHDMLYQKYKYYHL